MPKASRENAIAGRGHGMLECRTEELGGYIVEFSSFREDADATPLFKGLPDDRCQSPHWGYVDQRQADLQLSPTTRRPTRRATPTTAPRAHSLRHRGHRGRRVQPHGAVPADAGGARAATSRPRRGRDVDTATAARMDIYPARSRRRGRGRAGGGGGVGGPLRGRSVRLGGRRQASGTPGSRAHSCCAGQRAVVATSAAPSGWAFCEPAGAERRRGGFSSTGRSTGSTCSCCSRFPHWGPAGIEEPFARKRARALRRAGSDRARGRSARSVNPLARSQRELRVELVGRDRAEEWAAFLQRVYRLDTGPWLLRPHRQARAGTSTWRARTARSWRHVAMYLGRRRSRLAGHGRPRPGSRTEDYEPDAALCAGDRRGRPRARRSRLPRRHRGALAGDGHARVRAFRAPRLHAALRAHALDAALASASGGPPPGALRLAGAARRGRRRRRERGPWGRRARAGRARRG